MAVSFLLLDSAGGAGDVGAGDVGAGDGDDSLDEANSLMNSLVRVTDPVSLES